MPVLSWDHQPERIMPVEQWRQLTADDAPPGVYSPNMSREDQLRWKAKLTQVRSASPQVEIRKSLAQAQLLVIVGLDGWKYGTETREQPADRWRGASTRGLNVRLSTNGVLPFTFAEFDELHAAVKEAEAVLRHLASH